MKMDAEIRIPEFKSTNYELWKKEIEAWTVVTDLNKEKQAVAVVLNHPDDKVIKEKVFEELTLEKLNSKNGLSILFEFLDKHLFHDDVKNCLNKFEEFENFERGPKENIRDYVSQYDLIFSKLEKVNIKLPPELKAFKMLGKSNITKEERMIILAQVNYTNKESLYEEMKQALLRFGDLDSSLGMGNLKLEPAWRKMQRCYGRKWYDPYGQMKKKLNPVGADGKVLLCSSCGSYRHFVAQCPDSWENMEKRKSSKHGVNSTERGTRDNITDKEQGAERMREHTENAAEYVLKQEIQDLKGEIMEIKAGMQNRKEEEDGGQGNETLMAIKDRTHIDDMKYDSNTTRATELQKKLFLQKTEIAQKQTFAEQKDKPMRNAYSIFKDQIQETMKVNMDKIQSLDGTVIVDDNEHVSLTSAKSADSKVTNSKDSKVAMHDISIADGNQIQEQIKIGLWKNDHLMKQRFPDLLKIHQAEQNRQLFCNPRYKQELNLVTLQLILWNLVSILVTGMCLAH